MARKLSPLAATITLDLNKWTAGVKQIDRDSAAISRSLRPITDIGKQVGSAFATAGLLVGGALLGMSKKAADFGDALFDMSKKTGISATQLAAYKLVAEQSGASLEAVSKGVGQLSKNMFEAATRGGQSAKLFNAMGISVKDASGKLRDASDVMPEIAERFAKMEDGSMKTALAMKLFGKAGADLIPVLNEGRTGFDRAADSIKKYGGNIEQVALLGNNFNDALGETRSAMQGFSNAIGVALLPKLTELVLKGNEWIAVATKWASAHPELTMQVAKTSAALFGAGGLILGLTAIATIAPKVYEGVMLITSAFVKLGGAAGIAKLGIIGVAAAISTAVNMLPKLAIDKVLGDPVKQGMKVREWLGWEAPPSIKGGVPGLPENWKEASGQAGDATADWEKKVQDLLGTLGKTDGAVDKAANAAKQFRESVDSIKNTVRDTTPPSKELVTAIHEMDAAGQMTSTAILNLAKDVGTLKNSKDPLIQQYVRMIPLMQLAAKSAEMEAEGLQLIADAAKNRPELDFSMLPTPDLSGLKDMKPLAAGDLLQAEAVTRVEELNDELNNLKATVPAVERQVRLLKIEGKSNAEIMAIMGGEMDAAARIAKQLNVPLGEVTRTITAQQDRVDNLRHAWGQTFAAISDRLVDMIVDFDFSFKRLGDIAKDTAKSLARSFLDGFFKPFKDGLAKVGEGLATTLSGILFGGGKGGSGGGIFSGLGGVLGGIFGSKGSAGATTAGAGGILGSIFGGGGPGAGDYTRMPLPGGTPPFTPGGATSQLTGLAGKMNMASMGVSIANDTFDLVNKITGKIGAGRDSANEIIKSQNAFEATLDGILKDSELSATNKFKQIGNVWAEFQANLARFSAAGGEGGVTANQSFATLSPIVSKIGTDLIKQGASDGSTGNGGNIINIYVSDASGNGDSIALKVYDVVRRNLAGTTEEIVRQTELKAGAVVSR